MHFDKECTTPLAEKLISLYAEYVEGEIESAKDKYNSLVRTITYKDLVYMIYTTPFERHALQLSGLLKDTSKLPIEVQEKLRNDQIHIDKMNKILNKIPAQ